MDQACFCSTSKVNINYMSVTGFEGDVSEEWLAYIYKVKYIKEFEKFRYRIVELFGDLYYEKISAEEAFA